VLCKIRHASRSDVQLSVDMDGYVLECEWVPGNAQMRIKTNIFVLLPRRTQKQQHPGE
jgi:hypothetical protein